MSSKGGVTNQALKSDGRNIARANNQKGSGSATKKYAQGGKVEGSGQSRGGGAAVKGKRFSGTF